MCYKHKNVFQSFYDCLLPMKDGNITHSIENPPQCDYLMRYMYVCFWTIVWGQTETLVLVISLKTIFFSSLVQNKAKRHICMLGICIPPKLVLRGIEDFNDLSVITLFMLQNLLVCMFADLICAPMVVVV